VSVGTFLRTVTRRRPARSTSAAPARKVVLIVGNPNVGKSALFNRLTGRYVSVCNYPGTTVEISRGRCQQLGDDVEIVDTPGMYSLLPITEEERVARSMLLREDIGAVVHVVDAKNLQRMLGLTLQLVEAGLPVVVALNMSDEARRLGIRIDAERLSERIGAAVVPTVATTGAGVRTLIEHVRRARPCRTVRGIDYGPVLEHAIGAIAAHLDVSGPVHPRSRALMLLQEDPAETHRLLETGDTARAQSIRRIISRAQEQLEHSPHYHVAIAVRARVDGIIAEAMRFPPPERLSLRERLSRLCMHPLAGLPLVVAVLYFGLYKFVGGFGAGTVVDFVEGTIFQRYVNPWAIRAVEAIVPWAVLRDLIVGPYGIITLGVRYAVAIVLPIVGTFFLAFAVLEDSGYLPRLAMLIDRLFKRIGLNGRAVIPLVLGLGCDTMATMVTRTLETRRERVIATILLALAIPCSAQMGVIVGLLSGRPYALLVWGGVVGGVFLAVGTLLGRLLPGERSSFYMELPPLRLPRPGNVLVKTYTRMLWYFKEVLPLFILASVLIWAGQITGLFQLIVSALKPAVRLMGLPGQAAVAFLFGFFRRDYGAAGLYDLQRRNLLTGNQLAVAAIVLTLFIPCIAQFLVMKKEQGWKLTLLVTACIAVFAFSVGVGVRLVLAITGAQL